MLDVLFHKIQLLSASKNNSVPSSWRVLSPSVDLFFCRRCKKINRSNWKTWKKILDIIRRKLRNLRWDARLQILLATLCEWRIKKFAITLVTFCRYKSKLRTTHHGRPTLFPGLFPDIFPALPILREKSWERAWRSSLNFEFVNVRVFCPRPNRMSKIR